jgi:ADP-ribosyl-[dinitrogen reductase] hydrolase
LIDQYEEHDNANPRAALTDAVEAIDALLEENPARSLVVHCHGGKSRTGFVLKAWAMRRHGWSEREAHAWLMRTWDRVHTKNPVFTRVLREDWR